MANDKLMKAKSEKNGEFYTEYQTISNEMGYYRTQLRGKIIYCNCDDPAWSNFWKYFHNNFTSLGLKKLISTHYQEDSEPSYKMEYTGGDDFNIDAGKITEIVGNKVITDKQKEIYYTAGDFRSDACIRLLKEADIVITNPPFYLFREYVKQLIEYKKQFIILGNQNSSHDKDIFPLFKDNKIWYGASIHSGGVDFRMPDNYEKYSKNVFIKNGHHYINLAGIRWFTNLDVSYRHDGLWHKDGKFDDTQAHVYYEGNEEQFPKYYNYNGIDVDSANNIPIDYAGHMGVPITILDKFNPDELEIIGTGSDVEKTVIHKVKKPKNKEEKRKKGTTIVYEKKDGIVIWETPYTVAERKLGNGLRILGKDGNPSTSPFSRVIVRNKRPIKKSEDLGY